MSSNYVTPGQAYDHMLNPKKGYQPDFSLDKRGKLSSNVDLTTVVPYAGRVVHSSALTAATGYFTGRHPNKHTFEMGCGAAKKGPPIWLFTGAYDADVSNKGTPSGTGNVGSATYPPNWVSSLPGRGPADSDQLFGLVGMDGYEVETTEYDVDQTYLAGEFVRAVTSNTDADAGCVTNQNASGGAPFATTAAITVSNLGTDTVVGIVSDGEYKNSNNRQVLALYTCFIPGTR